VVTPSPTLLCVQVDEEAASLEVSKATARDEVAAAEKANALLQHTVDDLSKERDILRSTMLKAADRAQAVETMVRVQQGTQRTLENDILGAKKVIKEYRQQIEDLLEARERLEQDVTAGNQKYLTVLEQVCVRVSMCLCLSVSVRLCLSLPVSARLCLRVCACMSVSV
jgi:chromosome segregation ATPase